jgi:D-glutamate cyclase
MDLSNSCGDIDLIFELAKTLKIPTTSIGDGGNELGMGKAINDVKKFIKNGETIACCVPCDYLIISGVSNWGGLAISSFLFLLSNGEKKLSDYLVTVDDEFKLLECLVKSGSIDGVSGKSELTVDGLDYWDCHAKVLQEIINICEL